MVVSDLAELLESHQALLSLTERMCDLARAEAWDDVLSLMPSHRMAHVQAEEAASRVDQQLWPRELSTILSDTNAANIELIDRMTGWQREVGAILEEIRSAQVNSRRLGRSYGAG